MIVVRLKGGLGNQMFQYANARALALRLKQNLYLDLSFLEQNKETAYFTARTFSLDIFEVTIRKFRHIYNISLLPSFIKRWIGKPTKALHIYSDGYDPNNVKLPAYFDGYFQSEFYFRDERSTLLKEFSFKLQEDDINKCLIRDILNTTSVSIHFRRGDYVYKNAVAQVHGTCSLDYYENALSLLAKKYSRLVFYVFTDDPVWVKNNFILPNISNYNIILVNHNHGVDSWKDMYLMSICKHNIIANSSFSWWGAWLNQNAEKTVIAPTRWFADKNIYSFEGDIIPDSWIKV